MARKKAAAAGRRGKNKSSIVKVDLSGVETRKTPAEGEYEVKVKEVEQREGDKADFLAWTFVIDGGKFEGAHLFLNTSLSEKSLWNLKALLETLGVDIPDEPMDLDLSEMVDLGMMVTVEHETYEGKKQARIVDFWSNENGGGSKGGDKPDEDEINEMDEDDLAKVVKKYKLDVDLDDLGKIKKQRAAVIEALDDAGDDAGGKNDAPDFDEMDEDDLAKFVKKNKLDVDIDDLSVKKARKAVKTAYEEASAGGDGELSEDSIKDMDEDELNDVLKEHKLTKKVDLDDHKSLRKKQTAVIEALQKAGVLSDD